MFDITEFKPCAGAGSFIYHAATITTTINYAALLHLYILVHEPMWPFKNRLSDSCRFKKKPCDQIGNVGSKSLEHLGNATCPLVTRCRFEALHSNWACCFCGGERNRLGTCVGMEGKCKYVCCSDCSYYTGSGAWGSTSNDVERDEGKGSRVEKDRNIRAQRHEGRRSRIWPKITPKHLPFLFPIDDRLPRDLEEQFPIV